MADVKDALDDRARARRPRQERAAERFERILAAAELLLRKGGLHGFSIPALAERLEYTRGSIYAYFPTPHAVLNELAQRYLGQIFATFAGMHGLADMPWRDGIAKGVHAAADFYDAHPTARLLILGGAATDSRFRAQELTVKRIGDLGRLAWQARGIHLPAEDPDVTSLAIDLGMACFRRSVFAHGEITPAYRDRAIAVMQSFLEPYVEAVAPAKPAGASPRRAKKAPRKRSPSKENSATARKRSARTRKPERGER